MSWTGQRELLTAARAALLGHGRGAGGTTAMP
jgi:hypothetical protein